MNVSKLLSGGCNHGVHVRPSGSLARGEHLFVGNADCLYAHK